MLTDEEMDEIAAWYATDEAKGLFEAWWDQRAVTAIAEDLELQQREEDYRLANCQHVDRGEESLTNNPDGPLATVCYECGISLGTMPRIW